MGDGELDRRAAELQAAWCAAVDTGDLPGLQALFADGGTFFTRGRLMDAAERAEFFPGVWAGGDRSTHVCRDVTGTAAADGTIAVTARLAATFILPDGTVRAAWGRYDDVAVSTPDGLRLAAKKITLERVELFPEQPG